MASDLDKPYCVRCAVRLNSPFSELEPGVLGDIDMAKGCGVYKRGEVIFTEGDTPQNVFCVHEGKVKIFKTGEEGKQHIIRFARAGDMLGYRAILSSESYTVSAAALEQSLVCSIPKDAFFGVVKQDGSFSLRLMRLLSEELEQAEDQILQLAQKPVRERLAETLLILKEVYGTENGDNSPINVTLSREELANVVGTAIETLVRTLSELKRERLIDTDKKKIRIIDHAGLLRVSNLQD